MRNVDQPPEATPEHPPLIRFNAVRPLVRYVDEDQAVIETHFAITNWPATGFTAPASHAIVLVEIKTSDGFHDEQYARPTAGGRRAWAISRCMNWLSACCSTTN